MDYLPFAVGGSLLASVAIAHVLVLGRPIGVSGRISALIDRVRRGPEEEIDEAAMLEALRAMTAEEFGDAAVEAPAEPLPPPPPAETGFRPSPSLANGLFLGGIFLGGLLASLLSGRFALDAGVRGALLTELASGPMLYLVLFVGGVFVGVGTRMSGGCTSGHGLVGVSNLQPGSLLATACFFGAGIAASFGLEALR